MFSFIYTSIVSYILSISIAAKDSSFRVPLFPNKNIHFSQWQEICDLIRRLFGNRAIQKLEELVSLDI